MKVNDVEIQNLDLFDADIAEKYEDGLNNVQSIIKELRNDAAEEKIKNSEFIRKACTAINDFIDKLWGEGTAYKIFSGKYNIKNSIKAFAELIDWANDEKQHKDELTEIEKVVNKYTNRVQRRNKGKS